MQTVPMLDCEALLLFAAETSIVTVVLNADSKRNMNSN